MNLVASIENYYSQLQSKDDLKTKACCTVEPLPKHIQNILSEISTEVQAKYYGCGSPFPDLVMGLKILDIGCGAGRDVYILSKLVGENGKVYGIDLSKNQIEIAQKYIDYHTQKFGYKNSNVVFINDFIENIDSYFEENSLDIILSNCVFNLVFDKEVVLKKIYKILKPGGEFYFSDNFSDRRISEHLKDHPILYNECLSGAMYEKDFYRLARKIGFLDPRVVADHQIQIENPELEELVENIQWKSITFRLWKIPGLEDACEDYGQIAIYKGGIPENPYRFILDKTHIFEKGKPERVCGNTALMLSQTRYKPYFQIIGDFSKHFGEFKNCATETTQLKQLKEGKSTSSCGC
ncbi:MAG: methyltransferase domain-containing protein [Leptonema sp. (in: bacteria)]